MTLEFFRKSTGIVKSKEENIKSSAGFDVKKVLINKESLSKVAGISVAVLLNLLVLKTSLAVAECTNTKAKYAEATGTKLNGEKLNLQKFPKRICDFYNTLKSEGEKQGVHFKLNWRYPNTNIVRVYAEEKSDPAVKRFLLEQEKKLGYVMVDSEVFLRTGNVVYDLRFDGDEEKITTKNNVKKERNLKKGKKKLVVNPKYKKLISQWEAQDKKLNAQQKDAKKFNNHELKSSREVAKTPDWMERREKEIGNLEKKRDKMNFNISAKEQKVIKKKLSHIDILTKAKGGYGKLVKKRLKTIEGFGRTDPRMLVAVQSFIEAGDDWQSLSKANAIGPMQMTHPTAISLGCPRAMEYYWDNFGCGIKYDALLAKQYDGIVYKMLAKYNCSTKAINRGLKALKKHPEKGLKGFFDAINLNETRNYVRKILSRLKPDYSYLRKLNKKQYKKFFTMEKRILKFLKG